MRKVFEEVKVESFEWCFYIKVLENWEFFLFYLEEVMWVFVDVVFDDEFIIFV